MPQLSRPGGHSRIGGWIGWIQPAGHRLDIMRGRVHGREVDRPAWKKEPRHDGFLRSGIPGIRGG